MRIIGEQIEFRAIEYSDKDLLLELINDPQIEYNLGGWSFPVSSLSQEKWITDLENNQKNFRTIIEEKDSSRPIGTAMLTDIDMKNGVAEIHIKISKSYQNKRYGTEAINLLVKYAFSELRLNCIFANVNSYNKASQKLFKKCGFFEEGVMKSRIFKDGAYHDVISYSILAPIAFGYK